eukprot:gene3309-3630_t
MSLFFAIAFLSFLPWSPAYLGTHCTRNSLFLSTQRFLFTEEDDPLNGDLQALVHKVHEKDKEWLKDVLGSSLDKFLKKIGRDDSLRKREKEEVKSTPALPVAFASAVTEGDSGAEKRVVEEIFSRDVRLNGRDEDPRPSLPPLPSIPPPVVAIPAAVPTAGRSKVSERMEKEGDSTARYVSPIPRKARWEAEEEEQVDEEGEEESAQQRQWTALRQLGYSRSDILQLKDAVTKLILQEQVPRPRRLPVHWIVAQSSSADAIPPTPSPVAAKHSRSRIRSGPSSTMAEKGFRSDEVGNDVRWKGGLSAAEDLDYGRRSEGERRTPSSRAERAEEEGETEDEREEPTFWPSREEFKDLLMEESRIRVDVLGDWLAPLVRQESRWRLSLYDRWLQFLDEGLGDRFDVVEDDFHDKHDEGKAAAYERYLEEMRRDTTALLEEEEERRLGRTRRSVALNKEQWFADDENEGKETEAWQQSGSDDLEEPVLLRWARSQRQALQPVEPARPVRTSQSQGNVAASRRSGDHSKDPYWLDGADDF